MLENNCSCDPGSRMRTDLEELRRLEEQAAKSGLRVGVDRANGDWRAGFVSTDELGESGFTFYATGPDRDTAIRRLAKLASDQE
jgi:hypothetical protein